MHHVIRAFSELRRRKKTSFSKTITLLRYVFITTLIGEENYIEGNFFLENYSIEEALVNSSGTAQTLCRAKQNVARPCTCHVRSHLLFERLRVKVREVRHVVELWRLHDWLYNLQRAEG